MSDEVSLPPPDESHRKPIPPPDLTPRPAAPPPPLSVPRMETPPAMPREESSARVQIGSHVGEELEQKAKEIAPFNTRAIAAVIDGVVAIGISMGLVFILPGILDWIGQLAGLAYFVTRDALPFLGGQSVGKKAMNLRAVTRFGLPLTGNWEATLIRNGVLVIPLFALVELFILLSREDKPGRGQRLGDEWAKTKVIHAPAVEPPEIGE